MVIVGEASLAGTLALDEIATHVGEVGAKLLLVGDPQQLSAVDAGGARGLLVRDRPDIPRLSELHRFRHEWEKKASLALPLGETDAIDIYIGQDRVHGGDYEKILEQAYLAWQADRDSGKASLLIAETLEAVSALSTRARSDRIASGHVTEEPSARLHDGNQVSKRDVVVTRKNGRRLVLGRGWVKNGESWIVSRTPERTGPSLSVESTRSGEPP